MSEASAVQQGQKQWKDPPLLVSGAEVAEKRARLDWRIDPEESYSDWKIEISVDGKTKGTYHVHRGTLSVESQYFARLFANTTLKEHGTHTSCIEMEELAAESFPLMLDYLYFLWSNDENPVTAENAVSLHHLGSYFEIQGLQEEGQTYWKNGMTIDQAVTYLKHANVFQEHQVCDAVAEKFVEWIHIMEVDSSLMDVSDAKFWFAVLKENKSEPNPVLSTLVSSFCCTKKNDLDAETFLQLTDRTLLPQLSVGAAMKLSHLEKLFGLTSASATELSSLLQRTLDALTSISNVGLSLDDVQRWFKDLPPLVLSQAVTLLTSKLLNFNREKDDYSKKVAGQYVPKEIVVSGAAAAAACVNGAYVRKSGFCEGPPRFVMAGTQNGSPATFELYLKTRADRTGGSIKYEWFIFMLKGTRPSDEDETFYHAPREGNSLLPPQTGWTRLNWSSAMRSTFHFDELPDD